MSEPGTVGPSTVGPGTVAVPTWGDLLVERVRSRTEPGRFERGALLAREEAVSEVRPARDSLVGAVRGTGGHPYQVALAVRRLTRAEVARVTHAIATAPRLLLELLAGRRGAARALDEAAGVELFPGDSPAGAGLLHFACTCPDAAEPCKHAVAMSLVAADLLDATPALWLVLRGFPLEEVAGHLLPVDGHAPDRPEGDGDDSGDPHGASVEPLAERLEDFHVPAGTVPPLPPATGRSALEERDPDLLRSVLRPDLPRVRRGAGAPVEQRVDEAVAALGELYARIVRPGGTGDEPGGAAGDGPG